MISHSIYYDLNEVIGRKQEFIFSYKRVLFPLFVDFKGSDSWVIFFPGSMRREKPMPSFQRHYYAEHIKANVISLFDPTLLFSPRLTIGWFFGDKERHYATMIGEFLSSYFENTGFKSSQILLYGTSAGGLPAILMSPFFKQCKVYISNAQTDIKNYYPHLRDALCKVIAKDYERVYDNFKERLCAHHINTDCTLYNVQNIQDNFHYETQFLPYL